jgi:ParB family transcriptional regulator, chromosome partitioning protein
MSKLDKLMRSGAAVARESMGAARSSAAAPAPAGASPAALNRKVGTAFATDFLRIDLIRIAPDPDQPRRFFEDGALIALAESLRVNGQIQAIRVYYDEPAAVYRIVAGERRYRAAELAGLESLSCQVVARPPDAERLAEQLIENVVREDLSPVERADSFAHLQDRHGWSIRKIAEVIGVAKSTVAEDLIVAKLPDAVRGPLAAGTLTRAAALEIAKLPSAAAQAEAAAAAIGGELSADEVGASVAAALDDLDARAEAEALAAAIASPGAVAWEDTPFASPAAAPGGAAPGAWTRIHAPAGDEPADLGGSDDRENPSTPAHARPTAGQVKLDPRRPLPPGYAGESEGKEPPEGGFRGEPFYFKREALGFVRAVPIADDRLIELLEVVLEAARAARDGRSKFRPGQRVKLARANRNAPVGTVLGDPPPDHETAWVQFDGTATTAPYRRPIAVEDLVAIRPKRKAADA